MEQIEGMGSSGPKCVFTSATREYAAQWQRFPCPSSHWRCSPILHVWRHCNVWFWGCVWEMVRAVPCSYFVFPKFASIHDTIFNPECINRTRKYWLSDGVLRERYSGCKVIPRRPNGGDDR